MIRLLNGSVYLYPPNINPLDKFIHYTELSSGNGDNNDNNEDGDDKLQPEEPQQQHKHKHKHKHQFVDDFFHNPAVFEQEGLPLDVYRLGYQDTFCVIRNPYTRLQSEMMFRWEANNHLNNSNSPNNPNNFIL